MTEEDLNRNLHLLLRANPTLRYVLTKLAGANIRYGLYGDTHAAVIAEHRPPTDINFLVQDDDLPALRAAFPFAHSRDDGDAVFLYIGAEDQIEFMGAADVVKGKTTYPFRLTATATARVRRFELDGCHIPVMDPADTILFLGLLQRGPKQGCHDLDDIRAILDYADIDSDYLTQRIAECQAADRVTATLRKLGIDC